MQNYHNDANPKAYLGIILLLWLVGYAIIKDLADSIGVDVNAAFTLISGIVFALFVLVLGLWSQLSDRWPLTLVNVLPVALFSLVLSLSPMLSQLGCVGMVEHCFEIKWWGKPSVHYSLAWAILIGGYGFLYLTRD
ncbi:hypothetical protein [Pseudomonas savastanoi]|uniref:hypothetical protein n=1 Tax=Pseudomonas savastanoi TaxID=29438 RepID=UPI000E326EA7|nr:hypothetical protein [Pseudomonas savastanoi]